MPIEIQYQPSAGVIGGASFDIGRGKRYERHADRQYRYDQLAQQQRMAREQIAASERMASFESQQKERQMVAQHQMNIAGRNQAHVLGHARLWEAANVKQFEAQAELNAKGKEKQEEFNRRKEAANKAFNTDKLIDESQYEFIMRDIAADEAGLDQSMYLQDPDEMRKQLDKSHSVMDDGTHVFINPNTGEQRPYVGSRSALPEGANKRFEDRKVVVDGNIIGYWDSNNNLVETPDITHKRNLEIENAKIEAAKEKQRVDEAKAQISRNNQIIKESVRAASAARRDESRKTMSTNPELVDETVEERQLRIESAGKSASDRVRQAYDLGGTFAPLNIGPQGTASQLSPVQGDITRDASDAWQKVESIPGSIPPLAEGLPVDVKRARDELNEMISLWGNPREPNSKWTPELRERAKNIRDYIMNSVPQATATSPATAKTPQTPQATATSPATAKTPQTPQATAKPVRQGRQKGLTGGDSYTGGLNNKGQRHGKGTYTFRGSANSAGWKSGATYEGEYDNNKMHGMGTLTFDSNNKYTGRVILKGKWKEGKRQGVFEKIYGNGKKTWVVYDKGKKVGLEHGRRIDANFAAGMP